MLEQSVAIELKVGRSSPELGLASAISAAGTPDFGNVLLGALGGYANVGHLTLIAFEVETQPSALTVDSTKSTPLIRRLTNDYVDGLYKQDPNFELIARGAPRDALLIVRRCMTSFSRSYREHFFDHSNVSEKLTLFSRSPHGVLATNVYAMADQGLFSDGEIERLMNIAPLIAAMGARHLDHEASRKTTWSNIAPRISQAKSAKLTRREIQVCNGILGGLTSEAIAIQCGIGVASVLTFRKNLYKKLGIVSQAELFSLAIQVLIP